MFVTGLETGKDTDFSEIHCNLLYFSYYRKVFIDNIMYFSFI